MLKFPSSHTYHTARKFKWVRDSSLVVNNGHEANTYGPESKSDVTLHLAGGGVEWMIDVIGNISGKDPVVGAIAEKITNRHGCVRETMNKERF